MISQFISAILSIVASLLPLLTGTGSSTTNAITSIIETLSKYLPLIESEVSTVYIAVKNIVASLSANPATTEDQLKSLQELDAKVDVAWSNVEAQFDPDAADAPGVS